MSATKGWYWGRGDRVAHFYKLSPHYHELAWARCGTRAVHGFPKPHLVTRARKDDSKCRHCQRVKDQ